MFCVGCLEMQLSDMEINLDLITYFCFPTYKVGSDSDRTTECIYRY